MQDMPQGSSFEHGPDVLNVLNRDLANEMNTALMYMANGLLVRGTDAVDVQQVSHAFAQQDLEHAQRIAARIVELEGVPQLMPAQLQDNTTIDMVINDKGSATVMLKSALESELQCVIEYKNQIQSIAFTDPATRLLLEEILADKEHQVEQVRNMLGI